MTETKGKTMTLTESLITLGVVVGCIAGSVILKLSMFYGFATANLTLWLFYSKLGYSKRILLREAGRAIYNCRIVYIVIFLMGASISSWLASGVIPAIILYGMNLFTPQIFLLMSFWICLVVAMIMGTALGTISTVGIALLGIGQGFGLPLPMVLGAIVSGAYVSDKLSPISGLVNMNLGISGINYRDFFKRSMATFIPVVAMASAFYLWLGVRTAGGGLASDTGALKSALTSTYHLSPWLFLMPVLLIGLTVYGVKIHKSMSLCILVGVAIAIFYQGFEPIQVIQWLLKGFSLDESAGLLTNLLKGGGIVPMLEVLLIVACAVGFSGMIEVTGALQPFINLIVKPSDGIGNTQMKTGILSIIFLSIGCDQSLAIILPVKGLKGHYERLGLDQVDLSRVVFDTGVMLAPIEFWNVNTIIITAMTGLGAGQYGPYAILIWIFPLVATAYGYIVQWQRRSIKHEEF